MNPSLHLYQVKFTGSGREPFLFAASSFGDAEKSARAYALKCLDAKHQDIISIAIVALGCDIVNGGLHLDEGVR